MRRSSLRHVAVAISAAALAALLPASSVAADELAAARAEVAVAQQRLDALAPRLNRAIAAYDLSLGALAAGVTQAILAEQEADAAVLDERQAGREADRRVRALYIGGGTTALMASVLTAATADEAIRRVGYVQRLVADGSADVAQLRSRTAELQREAQALAEAADRGTVRARDVERRYREVADAVAEASAELARLSADARSLAEAQLLADRIAALNAAVEASAAERVANARATSVPPLFRLLYEEAAKTCRGMSWSLLAGVGQVESNHGANPGVSYAGAQGPMQFMPATFAAYGVDGDGDGDTDIRDPTDAVFSAANYLCANGAGRGGVALERAVWHYNHADWYVALVLKLAGQYAARDGA